MQVSPINLSCIFVPGRNKELLKETYMNSGNGVLYIFQLHVPFNCCFSYSFAFLILVIKHHSVCVCVSVFVVLWCIKINWCYISAKFMISAEKHESLYNDSIQYNTDCFDTMSLSFYLHSYYFPDVVTHGGISSRVCTVTWDLRHPQNCLWSKYDIPGSDLIQTSISVFSVTSQQISRPSECTEST